MTSEAGRYVKRPTIVPLRTAMARHAADAVRQLKGQKGQLTKAAEALQITRYTLRQLLKEAGQR